jgi:hypothetical protein
MVSTTVLASSLNGICAETATSRAVKAGECWMRIYFSLLTVQKVGEAFEDHGDLR